MSAPGTQTFGDQLGRAEAGSWQIADGSDLRTARAEVTAVNLKPPCARQEISRLREVDILCESNLQY